MNTTETVSLTWLYANYIIADYDLQASYELLQTSLGNDGYYSQPFFSFRADISPPTLLARYLLVVCPPLADVRTQTGINQSPGAFRVGWAQ